MFDFNRFIGLTEQALDAVVEHGSDHELFIASYLHGHFSLVISQAEQQAVFDLSSLNSLMQASLNAAFAEGELEADDQQAVYKLWKEFCLIN